MKYEYRSDAEVADAFKMYEENPTLVFYTHVQVLSPFGDKLMSTTWTEPPTGLGGSMRACLSEPALELPFYPTPNHNLPWVVRLNVS